MTEKNDESGFPIGGQKAVDKLWRQILGMEV